MGHWSLDDISWQDFRPEEVDPELLKVVKAAAMVEYNGADYAIYLGNVFKDDPAFREAVEVWAREEVQHGAALGRWAQIADPDWDFEGSFRRYSEGYSIPLDVEASVRGSRASELVARCIVEVGTSSYYSALGEAAREPVLQSICRHIAADELRHYKLFYDHLRRYLKLESIGRWQRVRVALGRIGETEDDELAYAYYAANVPASIPYDRKASVQAHRSRAFGYYRPRHVRRAVAMGFKAAGLNPQGRLSDWASRLAYRLLRWRVGTA